MKSPCVFEHDTAPGGGTFSPMNSAARVEEGLAEAARVLPPSPSAKSPYLRLAFTDATNLLPSWRPRSAGAMFVRFCQGRSSFDRTLDRGRCAALALLDRLPTGRGQPQAARARARCTPLRRIRGTITARPWHLARAQQLVRLRGALREREGLHVGGEQPVPTQGDHLLQLGPGAPEGHLRRWSRTAPVGGSSATGRTGRVPPPRPTSSSRPPVATTVPGGGEGGVHPDAVDAPRRAPSGAGPTSSRIRSTVSGPAGTTWCAPTRLARSRAATLLSTAMIRTRGGGGEDLHRHVPQPTDADHHAGRPGSQRRPGQRDRVVRGQPGVGQRRRLGHRSRSPMGSSREAGTSTYSANPPSRLSPMPPTGTLPALVLPAPQAAPAGAAADDPVDGDPVTGGPPGDPVADRVHGAGDLVAEGHRGGEDPRPGVEDVQVGVAGADRADAYQHLAGAGRRGRHLHLFQHPGSGHPYRAHVSSPRRRRSTARLPLPRP